MPPASCCDGRRVLAQTQPGGEELQSLFEMMPMLRNTLTGSVNLCWKEKDGTECWSNAGRLLLPKQGFWACAVIAVCKKRRPLVRSEHVLLAERLSDP